MHFTSCREDNIEPTVEFQKTVELMQSSIQGRIVDEDNTPIKDVLVTVKGKDQAITYFTDENGFFNYPSQELNYS